MTTADRTPLCPIPHLLREPEPSVRDLPASLAADDPEMLTRAPSAVARALARGKREERPKRRDLVTHAMRLAGHSVHVSVGLRPDGTVMEVFVDLHKEGAPMRGSAHIVATLASHALQHGTPLKVVCGGMRSTFFEPAGEVEGHESITYAASLFDLVAQVLELEDAVLREERSRA